jgi:DNA-binding NtrC family response regulator
LPLEPVLLVDDDASLRKVLAEVLRAEGYRVHEAATVEAAEALLAAEKPRLVVLDLMLPPTGTPEAGGALMKRILEARPLTKVMIISGTGDTSFALGLVRQGAYDFLSKPIDPDVLVAVVDRARARLELEDRVGQLETSLASNGANLLGASPPFLAAVELAQKVAQAEIAVLITGESGTGKEVFARTIHARSPRAAKPFVAINCGALTASLLEATLFGHKKGAFTGAIADAKGLFLEADGGTLFLDEIGDLELPLQVKLLRVLESGEVLPVGAAKSFQVDVRIISATHQPLSKRVTEGKFRDDLYWRIRGVEVELPRLADRSSDIALLAQHFLTTGKALVPGHREPRLSASALRRLEIHGWPGNLRELKHEMQRALVMAAGRDEILEEDLSPALRDRSAPPTAGALSTLDEKIAALEQAEIRRALTETDGNKSRAAELLGLSRQGLLNKLARFGLK